jgi:hypothetical protein
MPQKKPKPTPKKPNSRLLRNSAFAAVALLAVFVLVNWLIITPRAIANERQKFENASEELEKIANEIESLVGPADEKLEVNSCDRANLKNAKGPLSCNVSFNLLFNDSDYLISNNIMVSVSSLNEQSLRKGSGAQNLETAFVSRDEKPQSQNYYQTIDKIADFNCAIGYRYPVIPSDYEVFSDTTEESFKISLSCGGAAKAEHFDLIN